MVLGCRVWAGAFFGFGSLWVDASRGPSARAFNQEGFGMLGPPGQICKIRLGNLNI